MYINTLYHNTQYNRFDKLIKNDNNYLLYFYNLSQKKEDYFLRVEFRSIKPAGNITL